MAAKGGPPADLPRSFDLAVPSGKFLSWDDLNWSSRRTHWSQSRKRFRESRASQAEDQPAGHVLLPRRRLFGATVKLATAYTSGAQDPL